MFILRKTNFKIFILQNLCAGLIEKPPVALDNFSVLIIMKHVYNMNSLHPALYQYIKDSFLLLKVSTLKLATGAHLIDYTVNI